MKFKVYPEDFIVEEVLKEGIIKEKGSYKVFKGKKVNVESLYLKKFLEKTFNSKISFAGLKDKKSLSYFYFSALGNIPSFLRFKNFSAELVGYTDRELRGSDIEKNNFKIILREIKKEEVQRIFNILEELKLKGFPNYFDIQRLSAEKGFLFFYYLLKGDIKLTIKNYLLSTSPEGKRNLRRFKKMVKRYFENPERILPYAPSDIEREIIKKLIKKNYASIIEEIDKFTLKIYFEKFASFFWNKSASKYLKKKKVSERKGFGIKIKNIYLFVPEYINPEVEDIIKSEIFALPGIIRVPIHPEFEEILKREFKREGFSYPVLLPDFLKGFEFKGYPRSLWVFPEGLNYYYEGKKIYLNFSLPPGAYGTLLIKILMRKLNLRTF